MKNVLLRNILPIVCVVGSIPIMYAGQDGWGWLLFVAFMTHLPE